MTPGMRGRHTSGGENGVSDSLIRIELITHFHRNPGIENTTAEIAEVVGRDEERVECQLRKLVQLHILEERPSNGLSRYRYVPPHSVAAYVVRRSSR
jgi:predicted transcriptional regulator